MNNKLFATFCNQENLDETLFIIKGRYTILYDKIFVLSSDSNEYICTYNIDSYNTNREIIPNTILTHRKKESNTLYTINALNCLIKELNNNILDINYKVNWKDYSNSILLTQNNEFKKLNTKVHKIFFLKESLAN